MSDIKSHIISLSPTDIKELTNLAIQITANPFLEPELFCIQSTALSKFISSHIYNVLLQFTAVGTDTGFLLFKNFPIDNESIVKTPDNNTFNIGGNTILARVQSILLSAISELISYEAECRGCLFQDVVPIQSMEKQQTSLSSDIELEIHTEQAFSQLRPDILSLACLRGDPNAYTYVLPVHSILDNISLHERSLLNMRLWKTGVDLSFKLHGSGFIDGDTRGPLSILYGKENDPFLIFDQDLMTGINHRANTMIKDICNIYYNNRISYCLQSGDIILIDNRRAVHGRSSYVPKYDGNDRFLIRCFSTLDYAKSEYARSDGGRIVSAIYS
jgi:L-asparagine oxygenase